MVPQGVSGSIKVAIAGLGNCASSLIEGLAYYRRHPGHGDGLLFSSLCGYGVNAIDVVAAFDIAAGKVGRPVREAMYHPPNNFLRIEGVRVDCTAPVLRAPTLDGNPEHLALFVTESATSPVEVAAALRDYHADILINLLPTGSVEASAYYARAALAARCAFINCIPTPLAQKPEFQQLFREGGVPLFGDDIKSQLGTTILHRSLLRLLRDRGATLRKSAQINIGGNTDFANFVKRGETKLVSKRRSLESLIGDAPSHVGHHYDPTKGALKNALIQLEAGVFGGSSVTIELRLTSDDKPNSAGSLVDLIRLAKGALDKGLGGYVAEGCAFYMKSPPVEMADTEALETIRNNWLSGC